VIVGGRSRWLLAAGEDGAAAAIRAPVGIPLDVYVEVPDTLRGFVRPHEIPDLIRLAAPVYVKFGLRGASDI
jgi:hypothetical protein